MEDVTFKDRNGNQILGTLSIPDHTKSIIIISHGFSSSKESKLYVELQKELNKAGLGTLRYDYYGHGRLYCRDSRYTVTKDTTLTKCVESLKAAISFIHRKGAYKIGLVGSSFGGLISLIVASQDSRVRALALKSPVTEPIEFWINRLGNERIERWKRDGVMHYDAHGENFELNYDFWKDLHSYDTLKMARNVRCPVLLVHGGSDTVVPIVQSQNLAKIVNTKVSIVEGADHNYGDPKQYHEMKRMIIDFFAEELE